MDRFKLDQVVRNFISNAVKFTPINGHITVKVQLNLPKSSSLLSRSSVASNDRFSPRVFQGVDKDRISIKDGTISLEVVDDGAGISVENQKTLFQQYVQVNPGTLQGGKGSGLGLWSK